MIGTDFDHDRIQIEDRIHRIQRPLLPGTEFGHNGVGDLGDQLSRDLYPVDLLQVGPGVTGRHPPRHQRDDQLVEPPKTALMFRDQLRFERGVAISGHLHAHRAGICLDRLGIRAVTVVTRTPPGWVALLIAQMVSHLHLQAPRQNPRRQLGQHPLRAQKLQTLRVDLSHQTIHQLIIDHRPHRILHHLTISSRHRRCPFR